MDMKSGAYYKRAGGGLRAQRAVAVSLPRGVQAGRMAGERAPPIAILPQNNTM